MGSFSSKHRSCNCFPSLLRHIYCTCLFTFFTAIGVSAQSIKLTREMVASALYEEIRDLLAICCGAAPLNSEPGVSFENNDNKTGQPKNCINKMHFVLNFLEPVYNL